MTGGLPDINFGTDLWRIAGYAHKDKTPSQMRRGFALIKTLAMTYSCMT